ncbi:MAG: class C beta-lactamase [Fimbriimonas sp.]
MTTLAISALLFAPAAPDSLQATVDRVVRPVMRHHGIPGMSVAVTVNGKRRVFHYGVMSKKTGRKVDDRTLFEVGSVSKPFAATVAAYAAVVGRLSLADPVSKHLPALKGSRFDRITLLNLGTHTSGLPLFVPSDIRNQAGMNAYLRGWKPAHPEGVYRTYSNNGTGLLGMIAAGRLGASYEDVVERRLFPQAGMKNSFLRMPPSRTKDYAQGYRTSGEPVRMNAEYLAMPAYGLRTCAMDLAKFLEANMGLGNPDPKWARAIRDTHTSYYKAGPITQDLMWEQYAYPTDVSRLLAGNSPTSAFESTKATRLNPPGRPREDVFINKTGSTAGFSAYVAFVPAKKIGVAILSNRAYPLDARVRAGYRILASLDHP